MYIIMKRGSQSQKIKASYYFVLYTLVGSLPLFVGILFICTAVGSTNLNELFFSQEYFFLQYQNILWWFFFFGFATKIPMFPVHIWLPEAHVEAICFFYFLLCFFCAKFFYIIVFFSD